MTTINSWNIDSESFKYWAQRITYYQLIDSSLTNLFTLKIHLFYEEKNKEKEKLKFSCVDFRGVDLVVEAEVDPVWFLYQQHSKSTVHIMFPLICHLIYGIFSDTLEYMISQNKNRISYIRGN